jgi:type IV secretory pathway VirB2 component (pilin)
MGRWYWPSRDCAGVAVFSCLVTGCQLPVGGCGWKGKVVAIVGIPLR